MSFFQDLPIKSWDIYKYIGINDKFTTAGLIKRIREIVGDDLDGLDISVVELSEAHGTRYYGDFYDDDVYFTEDDPTIIVPYDIYDENGIIYVSVYRD